MHMDHKAGDKLYVDFAGEKLSYTDKDTGEVIAVEVLWLSSEPVSLPM
jgi:hypothetical protein